MSKANLGTRLNLEKSKDTWVKKLLNEPIVSPVVALNKITFYTELQYLGRSVTHLCLRYDFHKAQEAILLFIRQN